VVPPPFSERYDAVYRCFTPAELQWPGIPAWLRKPPEETTARWRRHLVRRGTQVYETKWHAGWVLPMCERFEIRVPEDYAPGMTFSRGRGSADRGDQVYAPVDRTPPPGIIVACQPCERRLKEGT
jgi:hypothetical protein